jgi:hypothetical protein
MVSIFDKPSIFNFENPDLSYDMSGWLRYNLTPPLNAAQMKNYQDNLYNAFLDSLVNYGKSEGAILTGTSQKGTFYYSSMIGDFAGEYEAGPDYVITANITKKPLLIPMALIQSRATKFLESIKPTNA